MSTILSEDSEFDVKASANRIADEGQSIQELIKHYGRLTRQFQDDVAGHVLKEVEESSRSKSLYATVAEAELGFLQNSDFIMYSHQKKEEDIHSESIFPTSRMREHGGADEFQEGFTEVSWVSRLSSSEISHWIPDVSTSLKAHGDIREVFLGWRKRNDTLDIAFKHMCDTLFDLPRESHKFDSLTDQKYVCFFNGLPFTPLSIANVNDNIDVWKQLASFRAHFQTNNPVEYGVARVAQDYTDTIIDLSSLTKKQFCNALWFNYDFENSSTPCIGNGSKHFYNNFKPNVECDANDNIVLVKPSRLRGTQPFRGFFIKSKLIAVEHIGAPVNISLLLSPRADESIGNSESDVNIMGLIAQMFEKLFLFINKGVDDIPASTVMTAAFRYDTLLPSSDISTITPFQMGTVLDVRPITPSLPFCWHFSWAEICALGQLNRSQRVSHPNNNVKDVVFKATNVPASSLLEYDTLSAVVFPVLNQEMKSHLKDVFQAVAPHHVDNKDTKELKFLIPGYPVIATLGATLVLLGVGLGRLFRSNTYF